MNGSNYETISEILWPWTTAVFRSADPLYRESCNVNQKTVRNYQSKTWIWELKIRRETTFELWINRARIEILIRLDFSTQ